MPGEGLAGSPNRALQLTALRLANATVFAVRSSLVMRGWITLTRAAAEALSTLGGHVSIQELGSIGEFIAAIATILTLVYLALQIRQNTAVARATATQEVLNSHRLIIRELFSLNPEAESVWVRGMHSFTSLSRDEQRRFQYIMSEIVLHAQNALQLREKGVLDQSDTDVWVGFALQILRMPGSAEWWEIQRHVVDPMLASEIDRRLQEPGESLTDLLPHFALEGCRLTRRCS